MSLASYADLKTAVTNWTARSDWGTGFLPSIDDLVTLFEAVANTQLKTRFQETTTTLTPDVNGQASLPADYVEWRNVVWAGSQANTIEYMEPTIFTGRWPNPPGSQGQPVQNFTIIGSKLYFGPLDSTSITFDYLGKLTALSSGVNWLFTNYPTAYLYGTLTEAYTAMQDFEKAQMWAARRDKVFQDIDMVDFRSKAHSGIRTTQVVV